MTLARRMTCVAAQVLAVAACGVVAAVPVSPVAAQQGAGSTVEAFVHDSLARRPLAGATVQLVSLSDRSFVRTAETDSLGRSSFRDIPTGRYRVGFMHALLDELGVTAPEREVAVASQSRYRADLAIPGPARLAAAVCGAKASGAGVSTLVGTVRNPRDRMPVAKAAVTAQWIEMTFGSAGMQQRAPRITARTGINGWFALCGLPAGIVTLWVKQGSDSTPRMDLEMDAGQFRRRDFFVSAPGTGQLRGRVVTADGTRPLRGARVAIAGGPPAESGASGEWSLSGVRLGTQVLEVRAVGFYPERRPVDVVADAEPVNVALGTFKAFLDAVRVTATRTPAADAGGYSERQRRGGMGRFLSSDQIARRNLLETSDMLRTMPGFIGDGSLTMKGNFSDGTGGHDTECSAEVYIDGHLMRGISAGELDALVKPEQIEGVEVYGTGAPRPPQFDSGMSGCGSLVIWRKGTTPRR